MTERVYVLPLGKGVIEHPYVPEQFNYPDEAVQNLMIRALAIDQGTLCFGPLSADRKTTSTYAEGMRDYAQGLDKIPLRPVKTNTDPEVWSTF